MQMRKWFCFFILIGLLTAFPTTASIIKKPPVKTADLGYKDLTCTEEQRAYIYEIVSALGEKSKLGLLFNQSHLKGLGERVNDVHPLKFLAVIFTNPYLKSCMAVIWSDYFKRNGFLDGLVPSLKRELEKGKLDIFAKDFALEVGVNHDLLHPYFASQDWENLVLFLIQS